MRVLVVSNMLPSPAHPERGTFVRDQVDALRRLGGLDIELYEFPPGARALARAAVDLRRRFAPRRSYARRLDRFDIVSFDPRGVERSSPVSCGEGGGSSSSGPAVEVTTAPACAGVGPKPPDRVGSESAENDTSSGGRATISSVPRGAPEAIGPRAWQVTVAEGE